MRWSYCSGWRDNFGNFAYTATQNSQSKKAIQQHDIHDELEHSKAAAAAKNKPAAENKTSEKVEKKAVQEKSISKIIDDAVKASKQLKKPVEEKEKPPVEKGKFEKQVVEKAGPRVNNANAAEVAAKDAIRQLQESGVKTAAPDVKVKKEIDAQIAQTQTQSAGGATPKLQR